VSTGRTELAEAQAALARALLLGAEAPADFDAERVKAQGEALARKREHEVRGMWPELARYLGEDFHTRFGDYARRTPLPGDGGPLADGHAFAREVTRDGPCPDAVRLELLRVELRWRRVRDGLLRRRGPCFRAARLREACCLLVALQLPRFGERWLRLPLGWRSR